MAEHNLRLEYLRGQLQNLEQEEKKLRQDIDDTTDPEERRKREQKLFRKQSEIDRVIKEIEAEEKKLEEERAEASTQELTQTLQAIEDAGLAAEMQRAYQLTLTHWPTPVNADVTTPGEFIQELKRIGEGKRGYSALEEFMARLVQQTALTQVIDALNRWGQRHCPTRNWLELYYQIEQDLAQAQRQQTEYYQPAILIAIALAEEATTQANNEPHYQLKAWLIEDIDTYRQHRTGYHSLMPASAAWVEPFIATDLEDTVLALINHGLTETNRHCEDCTHEAEFHIFLPKALMRLAADQWPVDRASQPPRCLGHNHTVVVRCAERYAAAYRRGPTWRRLWKHHEQCLQTAAHPSFIDWSGDVEELVEALNRAAEANEAVASQAAEATVFLGLKCTTAPDLTQLDIILDELLESGLPLAFWGRCQVATILNTTEIDTILQQATLNDLPRQVQCKRRESRIRQNTPDCHIGHHLFLLRDDPTLIPPKSA